jgi:hypothetical protein
MLTHVEIVSNGSGELKKTPHLCKPRKGGAPGKLHYYDDPGGAGGGRGVVDNNRFDKEAFIPLAAHTEYGNDDLLGDTMYNEL